MIDKEYKIQAKRVKKLYKKWVVPLGLTWYKITMETTDQKATDGSAYSPTDVKGIYECIFDVRTDYYYKTAVITAYLDVIKDIKDENLERYFLHELMHVHLKPMQTKEKFSEEELVATTLADVILWVIEAVKKRAL